MPCECCGNREDTTSGCALCNSSRTFCASCGALIRCGCGKCNTLHVCPKITISPTTILPLDNVIIPSKYP